MIYVISGAALWNRWESAENEQSPTLWECWRSQGGGRACVVLRLLAVMSEQTKLTLASIAILRMIGHWWQTRGEVRRLVTVNAGNVKL